MSNLQISNQTKWVGIAASLLFLAVCLGAFGAHALKDILDPYSKEVFQKASFYHFIHAIGLLIIPLLSQSDLLQQKRGLIIQRLLLFGIIVFSGTLYALAISGIKWLGAITPIGGTALIIAWLLLAFSSFQSKNH